MLFTATGAKSTKKVTLDKSIFGKDIDSHNLVQQAYVAHQANGRGNFAITKTRGEVSGGGKKPWKQKGTGRARFGSSRVPIWRGGGITFGPTGNENYSKKINIKSKRLALRQSLSLSCDKIKVIETFSCKDGKVKPTVELLKKVGATRRVLIVVSTKDDLVEKATRNIPQVKAVQANYLNVVDIMNADTILISMKSLEIISQWLGEDK
ncbi:50S ribosomal protein L4 [Candidatus Saccharibacteria bacterium RIFCSPHIGHO2_12_FULL_41_12]|nr:MAG: 50S ribosomal protein L4 [Candidatus Saccharibacteria bacterium RIFCSPHIGHO2_12_FULL_41_12]